MVKAKYYLKIDGKRYTWQGKTYKLKSQAKAYCTRIRNAGHYARIVPIKYKGTTRYRVYGRKNRY